MSPRRNKFGFALLALACFLPGPSARAVEVAPSRAGSIPCGILENFAGNLQILDDTRNQLIDAAKQAAIPCGGWVSVLGKGWAEIKHRDGFRVHLGANTFTEILDAATAPKKSGSRPAGDHFILYKGELYAQSPMGAGELRVITANGRGRISHGTGLLVFNQAEEETQLISVEGNASLENRFESDRQIKLRPGEMSVVNFKLVRVVPLAPRAVSSSSLRGKLIDLGLGDTERQYALLAARKRQERHLNFGLPGGDASSAGGRKLASVGHAKKDLSRYRRGPKGKDLAKIHRVFAKKMLGTERPNESMLYPDQLYERPAKVKVEVEDPEAKLIRRKNQQEEAEKRKLIDELSKIRED